ncbi:hypothetical protein RCIP0075_00005 [Klebsiella phage RCIP0075]
MSSYDEILDGSIAAFYDSHREDIEAHLRLGSIADEGEEALIRAVYWPAAWTHCMDFCNRVMVPDQGTLDALTEAGLPLRSPKLADKRFLAAVYMTLAYFYDQREDTGTPPKVVERLLWPLRASLGV